jgi:Xaa-Pro aminopeptidase
MHITSFSSHLKSTLPKFPNIFVDTPESYRRGQTTRRSSRAASKSILKYLWSSQDFHESDYDHILNSITSSKCKSLSAEVARLRVVKSQAEQNVMRAAADISGRAHAKVWCASYLPICSTDFVFRLCVLLSPDNLKPLLLLISNIYVPYLERNDLHMCQ